jgi:hypothetical protein
MPALSQQIKAMVPPDFAPPSLCGEDLHFQLCQVQRIKSQLATQNIQGAPSFVGVAPVQGILETRKQT